MAEREVFGQTFARRTLCRSLREMCTIVQAECRVQGMNGLSNAAWFMNDWLNATIAQPLKIIVVRHATF